MYVIIIRDITNFNWRFISISFNYIEYYQYIELNK